MERQYQIHTEPVSTSPEDVTQSRWHQPLSEPKRFRRALTVALVVSGGVVDPVALTRPGVSQMAPWFVPLSEPKRFKPALGTALIASGGVIDPTAMTVPESVTFDRWNQPLSEPKRFKKRLPEPSQEDFFFSNWIAPAAVSTWWVPLSEPRRYLNRASEPIALLTGVQSHVPSIVTTFAAVYTLQGASSEANFSGKGYDVTINGAASEINITIQLQDI